MPTQSSEDARAELAIEESQAVPSLYFAHHGRLPDKGTMTHEVRKYLENEGISVDNSWTFYCTSPPSDSPTLFVLIHIEGPNIRSQTYGYDLPKDLFEEGKRKKPAEAYKL